MDKVIHFELPVEDMDRAKKFYESAFQWNVNFVPEYKYAMVYTSPIDEKFMHKEKGTINGGMMKRNDKVKSPVITIGVENIDKAIENIKKNGGKIIGDKIKVGDMGISAYFQDTESNILGIWQNLK